MIQILTSVTRLIVLPYLDRKLSCFRQVFNIQVESSGWSFDVRLWSSGKIGAKNKAFRSMCMGSLGESVQGGKRPRVES